ncbi:MULTISPECIES: hypothetical protein [unclassified Streptomyces]|uniref:hypothetical protein n=1 Tax=unclassified Streptomyces TaxID=2593676 RepID=UPI000823C350|nr:MULTISPECIES: hypothetical protein [unclassified Streptomyces]MYT99863.1 hypothetical protein [Streptomyces sp. SID8350]SCK41190.1 hypothetical protein YUWDRAFT_03453 [Streptomyces sp. AmelKG-D3]
MTPSFDRMGGKRNVRAHAKEASSHLRDAVCSICFTDQVALVAQTVGVVLSLQEPPVTPFDRVTAVLSLISHSYQLYRTLKSS